MSRSPRVEFVVTADTRQALSGFQNLTGAITGGVFRGGLALKAFDAGLGVVQNSVRSLTSAITAATDTQTKTIAATSALSSLGNISYDKAQTAVEELNQELAKSAAALPGVTDDYKQLAQGISSTLVEAFKDPKGTLNVDNWKSATKELSENFGALTATTTKDAANTSLAINKALGGSSTSELRQLAFFEQNKAILDEIDKALKTQGKTALKDVSVETRVKILTAASQKLITEDFKKAAAESVDGLIQNFNTSLFDPSSGIFGVMRDLQPDTKGIQSVFSAYNETLRLIVGGDGILFGIGKILEKLGFQVDPMNIIYQGLLKFNAGISKVSVLINGVGELLDKTGIKNVETLQDGIKNLFGKFLGIIPDAPSPAKSGSPAATASPQVSLEDIAATVKTRIGGTVESFFARVSDAVKTVKLVVNSAEFQGLITLVKRTLTKVIIEDFLPGFVNLGADIAILIADTITGLVIKPSAGDAGVISTALGKALAKIDYGKLSEAVAKVVGVAVILNLSQSLAVMAFSSVATQVGAIVTAAILLPLKNALVTGLLTYAVPLASQIILPISAALTGLSTSVAAALTGAGAAGGSAGIGAAVAGLFAGIGATLSAVATSAAGAATALMSVIAGGFGGLISIASSAVASAGTFLSTLAGGLLSGPVLLAAAGAATIYGAARLMGASNQDIADSASAWSQEAQVLTGIKVDGIGGAIRAGFEIIRLSAVEQLSQIQQSTGVEINNIGDGLVVLITGYGQLIKTGIDYIYNSVLTWIADFRSSVTIWLTGVKGDAESAFASFTAGFSNLFTSVKNRIDTFVKSVITIWDEIIQSVQNAASQIQNSFRQLPVIGGFIPPTAPIAIKPAVSTNNPVGNLLNILPPSPKYAGQNIQSFVNFMGAVAAENKQSPAGASLVVANSSEVILPKQALPKIFEKITSQSSSIFSEKTTARFQGQNVSSFLSKVSEAALPLAPLKLNPNIAMPSTASTSNSNVAGGAAILNSNSFRSIERTFSNQSILKTNELSLSSPLSPYAQKTSSSPAITASTASADKSININSIEINISNTSPTEPTTARAISEQLGEMLRYELSKLL